VVKSFRSKVLKGLWEKGTSASIRPDLRKRIENRLEVLDNALLLSDLTSFGTHPLNGTSPQRYSMAVNGPWRITFQFRDGDAYLVALEQYH
jgi:proteic killer suppression protein